MECPEELWDLSCLPYPINTRFVSISPILATYSFTSNFNHTPTPRIQFDYFHIGPYCITYYVLLCERSRQIDKEPFYTGSSFYTQKIGSFVILQVFDSAINYLYKGSYVFLHLSILLIFRLLPFRCNTINCVPCAGAWNTSRIRQRWQHERGATHPWRGVSIEYPHKP